MCEILSTDTPLPPSDAGRTTNDPAQRPDDAADAPPPSTEASSNPYELPLEEYVWWALPRAERERSGRAEYTTPYFFFVRWVRGHPEVRDLEADEAFDRIERALRTGTPRGRCPWGETHFEPGFGGGTVDRDTGQAEFFDIWAKIRYRPGDLPLPAAWERAQEYPLRPSEDIAKKRPARYPMFVSLAGWLQVQMGNRNILLPLAETAELMGVDRSCISRYRRWAVEDEYLREMKPHKRPGEGDKGEATEFRFDVTRFPGLNERAQRGTTERT